MGISIEEIRKITIQAETQGVDQATGSLKGLAAAQDNVAKSSANTATITDVSTRKQLSAADAYQRQTLMIDPLARAHSNLSKQVAITTAAFNQGLLGDVNSAQAKAVLSQRVADLTTKYMAHAGAADQVKTGWLSMIGVEGVLERSMIRLGEMFAIGEILVFTKNVFENAAALKDQAERVGENVEAFQAQTAVLRQAGLGTEDAVQSIGRLTKNIGAAMDSTGAARTAFHDLGVTFQDLAGGPESAIPKVAEQLLKIQDATERARLEVALFGKSGQQLESSLRALADPTATLIEKQKALGQVMGTDVVDAAHDADVKINQSWNSLKVSVTPAVVAMTNALTGLIDAFHDIGNIDLAHAGATFGAPGGLPLPGMAEAFKPAPAGLSGHMPLILSTNTLSSGIGGGSDTAAPLTKFGQQEWSQFLKDQNESARLTGLSATERAAETEAIKESVKYQEIQGVSAKDLNHTYEGAKTTLDAHTLAHARNLGIMSEQNKAAEKLKETYDQYLAGLGQEAHDAGLTNAQKSIELDTIKAAQIVQKENGGLSRDQVKTYQDALNVLGPIKAAEVERAEQAKATAAFTLQSTQQEQLAQAAFAAGRDDRQLAVEIKQKELDLGRQLSDVEVKRLKTTQQLQDATRLRDYMDDLKQETQLAGLSADERARELAVIQQIHATHGTLTGDQADALRSQIALTQEMEKERQLVDGLASSFQDFFTNVLDTGKASFGDLWTAIKHQFDSMLAAMAAQALIAPIIVPVVEALGFGGGLGSSPVAGLGALGGSGSSLGMLGNASSLGNLFGSGADPLGIGSLFNGVGSALGFATTLGATAGSSVALGSMAGAGGGLFDLGSVSSGLPGITQSGSLFGSTTLSGFLGGAGLGSLASSLVFGNKNDAGLGGMGGAAAGAAIGSIIPGIGTIIGGLIGGLAGGGLGSLTGSSNQGAIANFNPDGSNYLFKQGGGNNGQMATQAAQTITTAIQTLQAAGVNVSLGNISGLSIGSDKSYVYGYDGMKDKLGGGDIQGVVTEIFNKILPSASTTDPTVQGILDKYNATGGLNAGNLAQLAQDIQTAQQSKAAADQAASDLNKQVADFGPAIDAALKKITDPQGAAFDAIIAAQQARLAQAQALGVDANKLSALSDAEINQFLTGLSSDQLHGLIAANDITGSIADQAQVLAGALDAQAKATADAAAQAAAAAQATKDAQQATQDAAQAMRDFSVVADQLAANVAKAHDDLTAAYNNERQALQQTITSYQDVSTGLRGYLNQIGNTSSNPLTQYGLSKSQFLSTSALAQTGDLTALQNLQQVASDFLDASKIASQTLGQYSGDRSLVTQGLGGAIGVSDSKVSVAVQQMEALDASVQALLELNKSTLAVKDAIEEMQDALATQAKATADNTAKVANILTRVTLDGTSLLTTAA